MSLYHPVVGAREKDVSTRLIKPTIADIYIADVLTFVNNWHLSYEFDGQICIFDEGIAQYLLCDLHSHHKFYASLILGKPSLRCRLVNDEPEDILDNEADNRFNLIYDVDILKTEDLKKIEYLKDILQRRGYKF